ncbi:MAG: YbaN family protein [Clostridia bacterium]|nr:YbaN family protein [Clostridia bacterium]
MKSILIAIGSLSLFLGVIGIFLPLLPTTPFLLLSAACYAKGSDKFYNWLIHHKYLGEYIRNYREKRGIPLKTKVIALILLWSSISYAIYIVDKSFVRVILFITVISVTKHLLSLKTL